MTDQPRTVEPALRDVSGLPPVVRPRLDLPIRTPRLVLRPLTPADYAAVAAYRRRPDVARYLGGPAWTDLSGPGAFEAMLARDALEGPARCATLGVERDGELVGHVVLRLRDAAHDALGSIGWVFSPWVAGLGMPPSPPPRSSTRPSPPACTASTRTSSPATSPRCASASAWA